MLTPERIDLHIPSSWNAMTTTELETISSVLLDEAKRETKFHPFNVLAAKVEMFFRLTELEVISGANPEKPVEEQYYVVRRKSPSPTATGLKRCPLFCRKEEPFNLYLWQIHYWMQENMKWLDQPSSLTRFPYPVYRSGWCKLHGPAMLMQNFRWRQYRIACDYMSYYLIEQNQLVAMTRADRYSEEDLLKQTKHVNSAKAMFLATIFNKRVKYVDTETRRMIKEYTYVSNQSVNNAKYFRDFPDEKFQCILFWWAGMMNYLKRVYPKCFKAENPKKQKQVNPLELYTRTTATMEKYLGIDEEKLNHELFTVVLQHIQDMVADNERMEKMNRK